MEPVLPGVSWKAFDSGRSQRWRKQRHSSRIELERHLVEFGVDAERAAAVTAPATVPEDNTELRAVITELLRPIADAAVVMQAAVRGARARRAHEARLLAIKVGDDDGGAQDDVPEQEPERGESDEEPAAEADRPNKPEVKDIPPKLLEAERQAKREIEYRELYASQEEVDACAK